MRHWVQAVSSIAVLAPCLAAFQAPDDEQVNLLLRERPRPDSVREPALLRIDASLVLVPVHVTNSLGATVNGLRPDAFHVLEDRVEQSIASFSTDDAPVSVGFLFDASGSMRNKMKKSEEAAAAFFRTANPGDEFFLVEFNDRARLAWGFTTQSDEIYQQIAHVRPAGRTTLLDAIYIALSQMKKARNQRKAIVILSDGGDNWSRHSAREIRAALLEADVQMYAMGIFDSERRTAEERNGPKLLDELTELTGGRQYPVDDLEELPAISERIGRELRSQYLLGYYSTNPTRDGKYRQLTVKLAAPNARELRTNYRRG